MSELPIVGVLVIGGVIGGIILSRMFKSESRTLESAFRIPFNLTWMLIGIFMIMGGFHYIGAAILILMTYFAASNVRRVRDSDMESSPGGWRRRAANWNPYERSS